MLKLAVLISGGGSNLEALLAAAADPAYPARVVCVGSDTDAPGLAHAEAASVPTFIVRPSESESRAEWGRKVAAEIRQYSSETTSDPILVVSAGLMRILPAVFVDTFSPYLINTHPALLPLFPGAHAVRDALAAGASVTGVTVHVIDEGVDTGPVLRQARVDILPSETESDLHERIKQLERPLLVETIREIANGTIDLTNPPKFSPNPHA